MKMGKRVFAVLMAVVMVVCAVPVAHGANIVASGTDGSLTWSLDSDGTLTISGTGGMNNYSTTTSYNGTTATSAPWGQYYNRIKVVVINDGVTSIGNRVFYGCSSLTSVTIGNSVTRIGDIAFRGCSNLTSVTIGNSVTSIDYGAFYDCSSLTSVTIPDSVTSIGSFAFEGCSSLKSVTISDSVMLIGEWAFNGCSSLTSVTIPDSVMSINSYVFLNCSSLTRVAIPDSVTRIGDSAFRGCSSLTSVTIPDGVTSIGDDAFSGCSSLTNVTIPDSVTRIGNYEFHGCSSLTSVEIPNSVTSIGYSAFCNCDALESIVIPDSVTEMGIHNYFDSYGVFYDCDSLKTVVIGNGLSAINPYTFYGCDLLETVMVGDSVTRIDKYAFRECRSLTRFSISEANTAYSTDDIGCMYNKNKTCLIQYPTGNTRTSFSIPDSVTSIGDYAFYNCKSLTSVTIGNGVTSIGGSAFNGCTSLTSVTIPDSVTSIGGYAFYNCRSLTSVTIGDKVTSIGDYAFCNCSSLTDVYYSGTRDQWYRITIGLNNGSLKESTTTIHYNSTGSNGDNPDNPDNPDDPDDPVVGNYDLVVGTLNSYSSSQITVDGTSYSVGQNAELNSISSYKNKRVIFCIEEDAVVWLKDLASFKDYEAECHVDGTADSVFSNNGNLSQTTKTVKIMIYNTAKPFVSYAPGASVPFYKTKDFYKACILKIKDAHDFDCYVSNVKLTLNDTNLFNFSGQNQKTISINQTIPFGETYETSVELNVKPNVVVPDGQPTVETRISVAVSIKQGNTETTKTSSTALAIKNSNYRSEKTPGSSGGNSEDADTKAAAQSLLDISGAVSLRASGGELEKFLTGKQLDAAGEWVLSFVAQNKTPEDQYGNVAKTIINKALHCDTDMLTAKKDEVSFCLTTWATEDYGPVTIKFTCKYQKYALLGSEFGVYGDVYYDIVGGTAMSRLQKAGVKMSGKAGGFTEVDMEAFCKSMWKVTEGALKSAYGETLGKIIDAKADEVSNQIFGVSINEVLQYAKALKVTKVKSVSDAVWYLATKPVTNVIGHCPMDVYVADQEGNVVASVENNTVTKTCETASISVDNGVKTIELYQNDYTITYIATANGTMNIEVVEYGIPGELLSRKTIDNIPLYMGAEYTQEIGVMPLESNDYIVKSDTAEYKPAIPEAELHQHTPEGTPVEAIAATCTNMGCNYVYCSICGDWYIQEVPATGEHADADNDGYCDACEEMMQGGQHCKYCGKIHDGLFGWLVKFFHSIFAIFKR